MSLQAGSLYLIFYGLSTSVQELGLESANSNGIFFGVTQTLGYLIVLPFTHSMPRRKWTIIFQALQLAGALALLALSKMPKTWLLELTETLLSTCVIAVINSSEFPFLFAYTSELFPTAVRGQANALVLLFGKAIGSLAPYLAGLSTSCGIHVLCGCGSLFFLSLPASFLLRETLLDSESNLGEKSAWKGMEGEDELELITGDRDQQER